MGGLGYRETKKRKREAVRGGCTDLNCPHLPSLIPGMGSRTFAGMIKAKNQNQNRVCWRGTGPFLGQPLAKYSPQLSLQKNPPTGCIPKTREVGPFCVCWPPPRSCSLVPVEKINRRDGREEERGSRGREGQKTGGDGEVYFWSCGTRKGASGIAEVYYGVGGG